VIAGISLSIAVAGCSTASKDISSSYVSPVQYQSYNCRQLAGESQRIQSRVSQLGGKLDRDATNDSIIVVVGTVLFWPAYFALGGTKQQEAEYARLKGEYEAVQQTEILKSCTVAMLPLPGAEGLSDVKAY